MRNKQARIAFKVTASALALWAAQSSNVFAQSATSISNLENQIQNLQGQLNQIKAQNAAPAAPSQSTVDAVEAAIEAKQPKLPFGSFQVGGVTVTLGGFAAVEGVYRSRNEAASVDTSFGSIPFKNSPNYSVPEYRELSQQSRFSVLTQANIDPTQHLTGYLETDFLSAGSSSNSNQSNSYTLRLRQFWGEYDNDTWGLHVVGGQMWSLATLYSQGLLPRHEDVPLTIDAQYAAGFVWERQPGFRVVKDFDHQKYWLGFSAEAPQTTFGSSAGPSCLTGAAAPTALGGSDLEYTSCGGSNVNTIQSYSDNIAPDLIAKVAADPGYGHYELYGILSFLGGRVSDATSGTGTNYWTTGEGVGGGMVLPIIKNKLSFQLNGLIGEGVGRYGTSQIADATFAPNGKIEPIPDYSIMGGLVAHPTPKLDLYAYGGAEGAWAKYYSENGVNSGYGNPNVNLAGCDMELGTCNAVTSQVIEGTVGAWYRFLKGSYGTLESGVQYEYIRRNAFSGESNVPGVSMTPTTDENAILVSFRYLPFN